MRTPTPSRLSTGNREAVETQEVEEYALGERGRGKGQPSLADRRIIEEMLRKGRSVSEIAAELGMGRANHFAGGG